MRKPLIDQLMNQDDYMWISEVTFDHTSRNRKVFCHLLTETIKTSFSFVLKHDRGDETGDWLSDRKTINDHFKNQLVKAKTPTIPVSLFV